MGKRSSDGSFTIPENRLGLLRAGVDKLNKRAAKLGFAPVVLVTSAAREDHYIELVPSPYGLHLPSSEIPRTRWVVDARLEGTAPRIGGFVFLARLDHQEGGNLVLRAPGVEVDLDGWRETGSRCQHCGLDRRRAATFLLQNEQGAIIQVGKQCLVDYTGTTDVEAAVGLFKCWRELVAGCEDEDGEYGFGGGWVNPTTPVEFLAATVSSIRHRGFHKSQNDYNALPTKSHADMILGPCPKRDKDGDTSRIDEWKACQPTAAQREEATAILAWVLASNDSSDFMHNARIACGAHTVVSRTEGILAALPVSYDKHLGRERERKERPVAGPHVGTVGERVTLKVRVVYVTGFEGKFASGVFMILVDENNSAIKVKATGHLDTLSDAYDFKDGEWFIRGTVKRHDVNPKRNNDPITQLTRCEMQREAFPPLKVAKKKPASKGKPMYGYKTTEQDGVAGVVATVAHGWVCPAGVAFNWSAFRDGTKLEEDFNEHWARAHGLTALPQYRKQDLPDPSQARVDRYRDAI